MTVSVDNVLPKRLPRDDRAAVRRTLKVLAAAGYKPNMIFDEDESMYTPLPGNVTDAVDGILGVDDATVEFKGNRHGDSFYVRFVMGNDPTEVVCDHSWREVGEVGRIAHEALDALGDRWIELEALS